MQPTNLGQPQQLVSLPNGQTASIGQQQHIVNGQQTSLGQPPQQLVTLPNGQQQQIVNLAGGQQQIVNLPGGQPGNPGQQHQLVTLPNGQQALMRVANPSSGLQVLHLNIIL